MSVRHVRLTEPVVAKQGNLVLLSGREGDVQIDSEQGLYFHDMRYLSAETMRLNGCQPVSLLFDASHGHQTQFELTNPDVVDSSGKLVVPKEALGIHRMKSLGDDYTETITVTNYTNELAEFSLQMDYQADFADMFVVRGMHPGKRGSLHPPSWRGSTLTYRYDGADDHLRTTTLHFNPPPNEHDAGAVVYHLSLEAKQQWQLSVVCRIKDHTSALLESGPSAAHGPSAIDIGHARTGSLGGNTRVDTSSPLFNQIPTRSLLDLHMLRMQQKEQIFFAAGVPWYVALFGRDSLLTAIEMAAFEPEVGANTLRVLAKYQGERIDDWRDEQPGRILHELRVDELANCDEIPQTPYYGTVDSTPLFLVLLGIYCSWTGHLDLFHELHDNVCSALSWIEQFGVSDTDGFIDSKTRSRSGARNQGWKDSANGIVMENGQLAEPPIALPEVQGYVYMAWSSMADLFERDGDLARSRSLREGALRLYASFNRRFWLPDEDYYALCRQADGRFSSSIASNAAHALWTGIVEPKRAELVVHRALQSDMFSGWGVRTLSASDRSYNPVDYQLGSVWPHDNAFIVAGMQRYGIEHAADRVFTAMQEAASKFDEFRLPEVFAGYDRGLASKPVRYPVACNPQAWAAGAIPYMLTSMLGLQPDGFNRRVLVRRPHLPEWLNWVTLNRLRIGDAEVDLAFERADRGTHVAVTRKDGDLLVSVEP